MSYSSFRVATLARKAGKAGKSPIFSFRVRRTYTSDANVGWKSWFFFPGVYFYILPSKLANLEIAQTLKENKSARVCDLSVMVLM